MHTNSEPNRSSASNLPLNGSNHPPFNRSNGSKFDGAHPSGAKAIGVRLPIRNVGEEPVQFDETFSPEEIEIPGEFSSVHVWGKYSRQHDILSVDLKVTADGTFTCTRCADPASRTIKAEVHVRFVPHAIVLDPDDDNVHEYDPIGYSYVDVTDDVRDAVLLAVPMKLLCRPNCRGICSGCGKELNRESCVCENDDSVETWSALKELKERLRAEESKRPEN